MSPSAISSSVLLVIPCFQESERLPPYLQSLIRTFRDEAWLKILVVDDGSGADEQEQLKSKVSSVLTAEGETALTVAIQFNPSNHGKGGAIYSGWDQVKEEQYVAFVDADGATSASELKRMLEHIRHLPSQNTAIFGSRVKMLGRQVERLFKRHLVGRIYATLVSELFRVPIYDSQCGCKALPTVAYNEIKSQLTIQGFAFDVDLLLALLRAKYCVHEFPLDWQEIPGGKVSLIKDSLKMLNDIRQLWLKWSKESLASPRQKG